MNHRARAPVPPPARPPGSASVRAPPLVRTPTPVRIPTPVRFPTPTRAPITVRAPAPFRAPITVRASTPNPVGAQPPASPSIPAPIRVPPLDPDPLPTEAEPLDSSAEPTVEQTSLPEKDPSYSNLKPVSSVTSLSGLTQNLLPVHSPSATAILGSTHGLLKDSTSGPIPPPVLGTTLSAILPVSNGSIASSSENLPLDNRIVVRVVYCYGLRYILLRKSLEQQFPDLLLFEESISAQASGEFEVFVDGNLVHSKKKGDGFVDDASLQKIVSSIHEAIQRKGVSDSSRRGEESQQDDDKG